MATNRSEKSPYPSRYSPGGWVAPHQYIIELVYEKRARALKLGELPFQFWKDDKWAKFFVSQLRKCHALLKKFEAKAIIRALKEAYNTYSLFAPWLIPLIETQQKKIDAEKNRTPTIQHPVVDSTIEHKQRPRRSNTILDKLDDMDSE